MSINKSTFKPLGIINDMCQPKNEYPGLKFRTEGHTHSDGEEAFNTMKSINYLQLGVLIILTAILYIPLIGKDLVSSILFILHIVIGIVLMITAIIKIKID